jgi:hypothetical protein
MNKYVFTFGDTHPYHDRHVLVYAENRNKARECMFAAHGSYWSGCYTEEQWRATGPRTVRLSIIHQIDVESILIEVEELK